MKIGIVTWDLSISGGSTRQVLELALNLQNMGHQVRVYTVYYNNKMCYPSLLDNLDVKYVFNGEVSSRMINESLNNIFTKLLPGWITLFKTEKLYDSLISLIDSDLDIICCHDNGVYVTAAKYKDKTGIPVVWQLNDLPIYKYRFIDLKDVLRNVVSPIRGEFFLKIKHTHYIKKLNRIVVMDNLNKKKLRDNLGLEGTIVRNGLDIEKFHFNEKRYNGSKLKILSSGIFFPWRRIEDLIEAVKIISDKGIDFELNHVGTDIRDKRYANKIYKMVKKADLSDHVKFHGYISEEKLIELYSTSDVFVFPNYPQTWGLSVFEAMGCGTPVIVSNGCGASEVLEDEKNALLVPPKSPDKIADALIRLKENPDLWRKLSINGRRFVEENIRWDLYAENMLKVFNEVLEDQANKSNL